MQYEDLGQLCKNPRARSAVLADMNVIGKEAQVNYLSQEILLEITVFKFEVAFGLC